MHTYIYIPTHTYIHTQAYEVNRIVNLAYVRRTPSVDAPIVGTLNHRLVVDVVEERDGWVRLACTCILCACLSIFMS